MELNNEDLKEIYKEPVTFQIGIYPIAQAKKVQETIREMIKADKNAAADLITEVRLRGRGSRKGVGRGMHNDIPLADAKKAAVYLTVTPVPRKAVDDIEMYEKLVADLRGKITMASRNFIENEDRRNVIKQNLVLRTLHDEGRMAEILINGFEGYNSLDDATLLSMLTYELRRENAKMRGKSDPRPGLGLGRTIDTLIPTDR